MLEDVSRALTSSGSNLLLKQFSSTDEILPFCTSARGIRYENRVIAAAAARENQTVELARDYDNLIDHNAIIVLLNGKSIGYIQRDLAQLIAPDMDCGIFLKGTIVSICRTNVPNITIRIDAQK